MYGRSRLLCLISDTYSALGVHDGKVYEALWNRAQTEPLNRTEVPEAYEVRRYNLSLLRCAVLTRIAGVQQSLKSLLKQGQRLAGHSGAKL